MCFMLSAHGFARKPWRHSSDPERVTALHERKSAFLLKKPAFLKGLVGNRHPVGTKTLSCAHRRPWLLSVRVHPCPLSLSVRPHPLRSALASRCQSLREALTPVMQRSYSSPSTLVLPSPPFRSLSSSRASRLSFSRCVGIIPVR
jgi:hypothetical protein